MTRQHRLILRSSVVLAENASYRVEGFVEVEIDDEDRVISRKLTLPRVILRPVGPPGLAAGFVDLPLDTADDLIAAFTEAIEKAEGLRDDL